MSVDGLTAHPNEPSLPLQPTTPPLRVAEGGVVRIGEGRISLDLIVEQYENGMTPEEMVKAYDTLVLSEVYAVLAYYLSHRDEVAAYLKRRAAEAQDARAEILRDSPLFSRAKLLASRSAGGQADAATGE